MAAITAAMCNMYETATDVSLSIQSKPDKKTWISHPYQNLTVKKNGKDCCLLKNQKDVETQHLSSADLAKKIISYLLRVSREKMCVSFRNKARKCN